MRYDEGEPIAFLVGCVCGAIIGSLIGFVAAAGMGASPQLKNEIICEYRCQPRAFRVSQEKCVCLEEKEPLQ